MIRKMELEDINKVAELEKNIFSMPWSEKSFRDTLTSQDTIYLVEVFEEEIVGYCGIWISFDTADLCNMAVAPSQRRKGIAKRLLQEIFSLAEKRQVERILLEVRESNLGAIALYRESGFQQIGIRKGYYHAPEEDAILMECVVPVISTIQSER